MLTPKDIEERIMRVVREEIRPGAVDTKTLRAAVRKAAAELGVAPPPDPRQLVIPAYEASRG